MCNGEMIILNSLYERIIILTISIVICSMAAGCNPEPSTTVNPGTIPSQPSPVKKLVFARANDSISLDPAKPNDNESFKVTVNIFETLVKYEEEGDGIKPCLALDWKVSEDGLVWVFNLRRNVRFHDGTPFNARAVEFNFHRWMDTDHPYHTGGFQYWYYIFSGFPGFVESVTALSDYSVKIILSKPYAPFLNTLAMPAFAIASPEAIKKYGEDFYRHPVGTGPFYFEEWKPGESISLKANRDYWDRIPLIDELEFRVIGNNRDRVEALEQGTVHIIDGLTTEDISRVQENPELRLYMRPSFNVGYLAMHTLKKPFDNQKVRLAVSHAINKDRLIEDVFKGQAKPAKNMIPPLLWGYNDDVEPYEYNPQKSKALLEEAGFPRGFKTTLWVMSQPRPYFPNPRKVALYIAEDLRQVGIDADIQVFEWEEYLNRIKEGEHYLALIGWIGDNRDPDNFLHTLLGSDNAQPGRASNYSFYKNREADRLLAEARQTFNISFRKSLYMQLQVIIHEDVPAIPIVHTMPALAAQRSVRGYIPQITGIEPLSAVDLDMTANQKE